METSFGVWDDMSIPASSIASIACGLTWAAGLVPAECTSILLLNDCRKPWAIWLRQLFPVQRIRILICVQLFCLEVGNHLLCLCKGLLKVVVDKHYVKLVCVCKLLCSFCHAALNCLGSVCSAAHKPVPQFLH